MNYGLLGWEREAGDVKKGSKTMSGGRWVLGAFFFPSCFHILTNDSSFI
jgi:hypothetical protein